MTRPMTITTSAPPTMAPICESGKLLLGMSSGSVLAAKDNLSNYMVEINDVFTQFSYGVS